MDFSEKTPFPKDPFFRTRKSWTWIHHWSHRGLLLSELIFLFAAEGVLKTLANAVKRPSTVGSLPPISTKRLPARLQHTAGTTAGPASDGFARYSRRLASSVLGAGAAQWWAAIITSVELGMALGSLAACHASGARFVDLRAAMRLPSAWLRHVSSMAGVSQSYPLVTVSTLL